MLTFKKFLINEETNSHMTHLEDGIILNGVKGAREVIFALKALRDMLAGNTRKENKITTKWDGAPAVFAGIDPRDGKFFVAKKGIFRKNPEVYKSVDDVKELVKGSDLQAKLIVAYEELSKLGLKGIVQGDIMFTTGDVKKQKINDEDYLTFHPNTILYAIPTKTDLAKKISKAKIGVVWHTSYSGSSLEDMKASYGVDVSKFKDVPSVWSESAEIKDLSGTVSLTKEETKEIDKMISASGKLFRKVSGNFLRDLQSDNDLQVQLMTYVNTFIRQGKDLPPAKKLADGVEDYIIDKMNAKIDKLKTEKGKAPWIEKRDKMQVALNKNKSNLKDLFELYSHVFSSKKLIINKLNKLNLLDTFVKTKNGFKVTGQEGFVIVDKLSDKAFKVVDRLEFSTNNFSSDIIKGWDSPNRG